MIVKAGRDRCRPQVILISGAGWGSASNARTRGRLMRLGRLGGWLGAQFGIAALLATLASALLSAWSAQRGFDYIETERVRERLERGARELRQEADALLASTRDYAGWDDAYDYLQRRDERFIDAHFQPATAQILGLDWVAFAAADGSLVRVLALAGSDQDQTDPLAAQLAELARTPALALGAPEASLLLWSRGRPFLVAHAPVLDTARILDPRGRLLFARRLRLTEADGVVSQLLAPGAAAPGIERSGPDWVGTRALDPWPALLRLRTPPAHAVERDSAMRWLALGSAAIAVLALLGLALLFHARVLRRLEEFAALARANADGEPGFARWPVRSDDEIDVLAGALNGMLERIHARDRALAHLATHDSLTALGNRRWFLDRLEASLRDRREGLVLVLIDVDGLRAVNEAFGPQAGDGVLAEIAVRLVTLLRGDDCAVRLGGDEFALLLGDSGAEHGHACCERLAGHLERAIAFEGQYLFVTVSQGLACAAQGLDAHTLLARADRALDRAKQAGGAAIAVYDEFLDPPRRLPHAQAIQAEESRA